MLAGLEELDVYEVAQLAGEGLLVALAHDTPGASEATRHCVRDLGARHWNGDSELAAQLTAALDEGTLGGLRTVAVDLEELSSILEGDGSTGDGRVDLTTGQVWTESAMEYAEEEDEGLPGGDEPGRWLYVSCEGSRAGYGDMEVFIARLVPGERTDLLSVAIRGSGAFRRFREVLERWPEDQERFLCFSDERRRGRARAWLAAAGVAAVPEVLRPAVPES